MSIDTDKLDTFTRAYIEAALWASTDDAHGIEDIDEATLARMVADCTAFQQDNADALAQGTPERAGHDFWLTRCGHGAGFWDGGWPEAVGEALTRAASAYGNVNLYVGDDGWVYAMGCERAHATPVT